MKYLELLAPARNIDIGIAAIDCGADAVYIAGPDFGARKDAGNGISDIKRLCDYAHRFGARVFVTVNTIIYDDELDKVHSLMLQAQEAGADAFIVQDLALLSFDDVEIPLHASTQCAIRDVETALFYQNLGFSRIVLERQLPLNTVREINSSVKCETEFFVHGALCVSYSGNCYLSESIDHRSANRGECIQACRSLYDLQDAGGNTIVRNKAVLSLKDYCLVDRMEDLAGAGVVSFKIEGRLKNISYVKNVVREYSQALDRLVESHPDKYIRASFGKVSGGFEADVTKTFNRGYTSLFLNGERSQWSSMDAPKSMGEFLGTVIKTEPLRQSGGIRVTIKPVNGNVRLSNGDGFSFVSGDGIKGFRGDVCRGVTIECKQVPGLHIGSQLYRNISSSFEKELEKSPCTRSIDVRVDIDILDGYTIQATAESEDSRTVSLSFDIDTQAADNQDRMASIFNDQISKKVNQYSFEVRHLFVRTKDGKLPFVSASFLNNIRRELAEALDNIPVVKIPMSTAIMGAKAICDKNISYKQNIANKVAREIVTGCGASCVDPAFELSHNPDAELMRTKYCVKYELGMCPVRQGGSEKGNLYLLNNGKRYVLGFDCKNCEMTVKKVRAK